MDRDADRGRQRIGCRGFDETDPPKHEQRGFVRGLLKLLKRMKIKYLNIS